SSIEFVAYAQKINENKFLIKHTIGGRIKKWEKIYLKNDEPFIKWLLENREPLIIENASTHLLLPSFFRQQSKPLLFLAYPLMVDNELVGILFGGSFHKKFFATIAAKKTLQIAADITTLRLQHEKTLSAVDQHLMQLSMLNDIGLVMSDVHNVEELLHMMGDLAYHLISSKLFVVAIGDKYLYIKNDKVVSKKQLNEYTSRLKNRYFERKNKNETVHPKLFKASFGLMIEVPFLLSETMVGVLALHMDKEEKLKEAEVYTNTLLTIIYDKLRRLVNDEKDNPFVISPEQKGQTLFDNLTRREVEVLKYLVQGYSNREISENLFISIHTVKNHISNIFRKLDVSDRSQLIAMVYKARLYGLINENNK
ncbi:LuxR C-terminal-related transcriptional regulator, partial [Anoxybacillus gonensis]|uniref:LuxR C-terminal-related transcriptional regulator n=1 Tax=Anoxybacillus gonensis TaxID=198467 RepID=UPI0027315575